MKNFKIAMLILLIIIPAMITWQVSAQQSQNKSTSIKVSDLNGKLVLELDCRNRCAVSTVKVLGHQVAGNGSAVFSSVTMNGKLYTSAIEIKSPDIINEGKTVKIEGISFGEAGRLIKETWTFRPDSDFIDWTIRRDYPGEMTFEDTGFPGWSFDNMETWDGALLGTGGVAWCKFFDRVNASLGNHTGQAIFWSKKNNICLSIEPFQTGGNHVAERFSRQPDERFTLNYTVSEDEVRTKNFLARFIIDRQDIWDAFDARGTVSVTYRLKAGEYDKTFNRGVMAGINSSAVGDVLNTIARVGVIDEKLMGSNNWHLDMGYVCLHEHWVAQMGLAINDPAYNENYRKTLDYFRDNAIQPDGNVRDRWAYRMWDSRPGTFSNGFYECQWGDLFDSNTDYVINVADLFQINGDSAWVISHLNSCEKALSFLLNHDSDNNGLIEVPAESHTAKKGSDWIDVIWASWENAFINAKLYHALTQWATVEEITGNFAKADYYRGIASRCKQGFNRPVSQGGFWNPEKNWYIYWRDKDGSAHGDNLVTPVNFMAISFGICDDKDRKKAILDKIESLMQKENIFMWPISFFPYQPDEGLNVNYPFPNYENGDIFLAWGEAGIRAYSDYDPAIPVKYIKNVLRQYEKDGLAFQRYLRIPQTGSGSDILANNCMPVVGLYRDIYGIEPRYNRLVLDPHLTPELNGTRISYRLRGQEYFIGLSTDNYRVDVNSFSVISHKGFGMSTDGNNLLCYRGDSNIPVMKLSRDRRTDIPIEFISWNDHEAGLISWKLSGFADNTVLSFEIGILTPRQKYSVIRNNVKLATFMSDQSGKIQFAVNSIKGKEAIFKVIQEE